MHDTPQSPSAAGSSTHTAGTLRADLLLAGAVAAAAFVLRYVYLLQARACPMFDGVVVDGDSYWRWASTLVGGDWIGTRIFYQAPLYPYFLGITRLAVGDDLWNVRLVQIALGAVACGILAVAGRRFLGMGAGIATGVLAAAYPPAIFFDGCIQKAGIGFLWMALLLLALALVRERPSLPRWTGLGAALGALMLTREETVLLAPALAAWSLFAFRASTWPRRAANLAAFGLGLALLLAPVASRNKVVGGEFVLTTSQAGPNFYIGNNPRADGTYIPLRGGRQNPEFERQDAFELAAAEAGRKLSPSEVSRFWISKSFAWIRDDPAGWLALLVRKAGLLVNAYELPDADDIYFYERYAGVLRWPFRVLHMGTLLPLAVLGLALTWSRRRELLPLHLVLSVLSAGVVLFYVFARYRYPVVSVLLVFAGAGLVEGARCVRARAWRRLTPPLVLAALAAVAANAWRPYSRDASLTAALANSAVVQAQRGDHARALEFVQQALARKPGSSEYWGNAGLSYMALERFDEAATAFRRSLECGPADPARAHLRLGYALARSGRSTEGLPHIDASLAARPEDLEALSYRARALLEVGRVVESVATLRRILELRPGDRETRLKLAWTLATARDAAARNGAEAVAIASAVDRELEGRDLRARDVLAAALAEAGRPAEAAAIVRAIADAVEARSGAAAAANWRAATARYERGEPMRSP